VGILPHLSRKRSSAAYSSRENIGARVHQKQKGNVLRGMPIHGTVVGAERVAQRSVDQQFWKCVILGLISVRPCTAMNLPTSASLGNYYVTM
jgi:hypothetical protein